MKLDNIKIGLGVTGSFCNFKKIDSIIEQMKNEGVKEILPIISNSLKEEENRFGTPKDIVNKLETLTGNKVIDTISKAEPIGPKELIDVLVITPCSGNTLAKLANGIIDTPVLMAAKSHIRNNKPILLGISTNDGLGANAKNIGKLLETKNIFFIPFGQDDYTKKPKSLVCRFDLLIDSIVCALEGNQIQPILA